MYTTKEDFASGGVRLTPPERNLIFVVYTTGEDFAPGGLDILLYTIGEDFVSGDVDLHHQRGI